MAGVGQAVRAQDSTSPDCEVMGEEISGASEEVFLALKPGGASRVGAWQRAKEDMRE